VIGRKKALDSPLVYTRPKKRRMIVATLANATPKSSLLYVPMVPLSLH
jgi:hypothetical protein